MVSFLHRRCIDPLDWQRTCAGCWKALDIREPHVSRYQDTERYHFDCAVDEPWFPRSLSNQEVGG